MKKLIVIDLDGTLADGNHRLHHLKKEPRDWDSFYAECFGDSPHHDVIELVNSLSDDYTRLILTGRRESTRLETEEWLRFHNVKYDLLIMRPEGLYMDDHIWKPSVLKTIGTNRIHMVFEDRNRIVKALRAMGLRVIHVADGDF